MSERKDFHEKKEMNPSASTEGEHSMVCHEGLFYEGLRAAIEDMEQEDSK
jgi:hypothetical protein